MASTRRFSLRGMRPQWDSLCVCARMSGWVRRSAVVWGLQLPELT